ncbi:MAG TPA: GNAT family N-acetyltransferase [Ktedonobacterales bacterium]|nr:GNAT family N-acetyltransferase [Ktedonobacterales bacterium]
MSQRPPLLMDDHSALAALDVHFAMALGCSAADLRRPGWTVVTARDDGDPMALLFGKRRLLSVIVPRPQPASAPLAGVARVAPELRESVAALLAELPLPAITTHEGLRALDRLIASGAPAHDTALREAHTHVRYVTQQSFRPYRGAWQEWIEPLDEASELDTGALGLLANFGGGVYVVRRQGHVVSYAGIRTLSPHVAEVQVRTSAEELRGHGLARAVVSRATRAMLAGGRLPLYRHRTTHPPSERVAHALGYRLYADAIDYIAPAR